MPTETPNSIQYINKKGKPVKVTVTNHARSKFLERYNRVFLGAPITLDHVDEAIKKWWDCSVERTPETRKMRTRVDRHGSDTIYFKSNYFVFVVQSGAMVTVELGSKDTRHLNRKDGKSPLMMNKEKQLAAAFRMEVTQ